MIRKATPISWEVLHGLTFRRVGWINAMSNDRPEDVMKLAKAAYPSCFAPILYSQLYSLPRVLNPEPINGN